ncbi:probable arabinosyltransferase ARAD1 [Telopea speciosissima]|uniref:probable arabinosyltransferase ARAD1 n=1 Tax=Telopea speciosissima TaxID=54955 RepID=UPI001CC5AE4C|nr:probable arabinosyltransferase ARAD1 [Telopea speciosissima]
MPSLLLSFSILCVLSVSLFFLFFATHKQYFTPPAPLISSSKIPQNPNQCIRVYVAELPRSLNYGLLDKYWTMKGDSRLGSDVDNELRSELSSKGKLEFPLYPENPLIKQYSAEYWILGDLMTTEEFRERSFARRVFKVEEADVIFVPFFATLSAEMQLGMAKGAFRRKIGNEDYERQKQVVDLIHGTDAWKRSGGRDHVFVLTDPVAMWHVRAEIAPAVLLVVDFGGWYGLDSNTSSDSNMIQHTQVSLLKDVIVPYTHLLPILHLSENQDRQTLLYFKGAKHRHRGGLVREKLWDLLANEPGVVMEEGFPNATGREQSIKGMRTSEFCLHPAGDTPTSCRLFDAIQSLCIPVVVSENIELPFEGMVDYMNFSVFVSVNDALQPKWLVHRLKMFSKEQKNAFRQNMARIQPILEYDNGYPGGIGPVSPDGAVNHIWKKVHQKLPMIKEAIIREKRKPKDALVPLRCHCT